MISPERLRFYPLFAGQSYYMLKEIARISNEVIKEEGDWLFQEGDEASKFYIVVEGGISLTMYLHLNGKGQHIATTSPIEQSELIGWSSLVKPHGYVFGAKAAKKSRLLEIDAEPLRELLDDNPVFGYYLMKNITEVIGERLEFKCIQLLSMVVDTQGNINSRALEHV
jgi:CRP-like cAMP-binding protein